MYQTGGDAPPDVMRGAPSPYTSMMQGSSAGSPAGGYSSSGGSQAGPWGTQAPNYPSFPGTSNPPVRGPQGGASGWPQQPQQSGWPATSGWPGGMMASQQAQQPPPQAPQAPVNTNGYPQPQAPPPTGYSKQALSGWDQTKWSDASYMSPKYMLGRVMSKYAPGAAGAQQVAAEMARLIPGTTFDGQDMLSIPGVGNIDILAASHTDHPSWWYGDTSAPRPGSASQQQMPQQGGVDPYAAMMQMLMQQPQYAQQPQQAQQAQSPQSDPAVAQLLTQLNTLLTEMHSSGGRSNAPSFSFY